MNNITVTLSVTYTEDKVDFIALAKGYNPLIQDGTKQEEVKDENGNVVGTQEVPNMIPNPMSAVDYVTEIYKSMIEMDIFHASETYRRELEVDPVIEQAETTLRQAIAESIGDGVKKSVVIEPIPE